MKKIVRHITFLFLTIGSIWVVILNSTFCFAAKNMSQGSHRQKVLQEGSHWILNIHPTDRVHVHNTKTIKVKDNTQSLQIVAVSSGEALLTVGMVIYDIQVLQKKTFQLYKALYSELKNLIGLKIEIKNAQIYITGQLHRLSDWVLLSQVTRLSLADACEYSCYQWAAKVDKDLEDQISVHFKVLLKSLTETHYSVTVTPEVNIQIFEPASLAHPHIVDRLFTYGLTPIIHKKTFNAPSLVRVQLLILELNKSWKEKLGLEWSLQISKQLLRFQQDQSSLMAQLQFFEDQGFGQILASPMLVAESGGKAKFMVGGEFPIRVSGYKSRQVIWKKHGVLVTVEPRIKDSGELHLKLELELSMIDPGQTIDGIPGMKTHRVSTEINSLANHTTAISGLLKQFRGHSSNSVPWLSKIPLLGKVFSSDDYIKNRSELVMFVTPYLVAKYHNDKKSYPKSWRPMNSN